MGEHELELARRAEQGDTASMWALEECARLVDKANSLVRELWELRKRLGLAHGGEASDGGTDKGRGA